MYYETNRQIKIPYLLKIGPDKLQKIGKYLFDKEMLEIALFLGEGIEDLFGATIFKSLDEHKIKINYQKVVTTTSLEDITSTSFDINPVNAIIGIGGGKTIDFAKYVAHLLKLPFISVPTSIANDGFCSPMVSLTINNKRKTIKAEIPFGVIIDLTIIKNGPKSFLYAGLGDMISKVTALYDWKMAFLKGYECFNDFASMLAYNSLDLLFLKYSSDITTPEFQRGLANSLLTSGLTIEIAGTTRPASGAEHLISHALDQISKKPKMHGIQVGISTYLIALLQNNPNINDIRSLIIETGMLDYIKNDPFDKKEYLEALQLAPSIKPNYYTILSMNDSLKNASKLLDTDPLFTIIN